MPLAAFQTCYKFGITKEQELDTVASAHSTSIWEAEARGLSPLCGQTGLQSELRKEGERKKKQKLILWWSGDPVSPG